MRIAQIHAKLDRLSNQLAARIPDSRDSDADDTVTLEPADLIARIRFQLAEPIVDEIVRRRFQEMLSGLENIESAKHLADLNPSYVDLGAELKAEEEKR
jgi:hypothetical protein